MRDSLEERRIGRQALLAAGCFRIAHQHRAVAAQQCCDPGRRKLGIEFAEILRRDRNDADAGEPAVDFALAADREKLGVGGAGLQHLGDIGTVHRVVVVSLEIVPVREVDSRHREHRAGDQRIAVGADDPQIAQLRHRHRHRAKPLGIGSLRSRGSARPWRCWWFRPDSGRRTRRSRTPSAHVRARSQDCGADGRAPRRNADGTKSSRRWHTARPAARPRRPAGPAAAGWRSPPARSARAAGRSCGPDDE